MQLTIQVICDNLPGSRFVDGHHDAVGIYEPLYLGIQQGERIIEEAPANSKQAEFKPTFRVAPLPDGGTNFLGPFAKGRPKERFFYLSWVVKESDGSLTMFRRAKVGLSHLRWNAVEHAMASGNPLVVRLSMTDGKGEPVCGSVKGERIRWEGI